MCVIAPSILMTGKLFTCHQNNITVLHEQLLHAIQKNSCIYIQRGKLFLVNFNHNVYSKSVSRCV